MTEDLNRGRRFLLPIEIYDPSPKKQTGSNITSTSFPNLFSICARILTATWRIIASLSQTSPQQFGRPAINESGRPTLPSPTQATYLYNLALLCDYCPDQRSPANTENFSLYSPLSPHNPDGLKRCSSFDSTCPPIPSTTFSSAVWFVSFGVATNNAAELSPLSSAANHSGCRWKFNDQSTLISATRTLRPVSERLSSSDAASGQGEGDFSSKHSSSSCSDLPERLRTRSQPFVSNCSHSWSYPFVYLPFGWRASFEIPSRYTVLCFSCLSVERWYWYLYTSVGRSKISLVLLWRSYQCRPSIPILQHETTYKRRGWTNNAGCMFNCKRISRVSPPIPQRANAPRVREHQCQSFRRCWRR